MNLFSQLPRAAGIVIAIIAAQFAPLDASAQSAGANPLVTGGGAIRWGQLNANDWAKLDRRFDIALPKELMALPSLTTGNCYAMDPPSPDCARMFKEKYQAMMVRTTAGRDAGNSDNACATKADVIAAVQQVQGSSSERSKPKYGPATDPARPSLAGKKADDYDGSRPVTLKTYDEWEKQVKKELDEEEKRKKAPAPTPTPSPEPKKK